ncbi:MAG: hypothetical protein AAGD07_24445 [Planctomycetota bacterium]
MKRRDFAKTAAIATLGSPRVRLAFGEPVARPTERRGPMVGVQIAPVSLFDEGIDRCLDTLLEKASINTLFIYSQTYHAGTKPSNVLATDHGVPVRDFRNSQLPYLWVQHGTKAFAGKVVQHERPNKDLEYGDRDLFREIRKPAEQRGMKVYARILEADARRAARIPGYRNVLTIDHEGKRGHGPCWNNPHYREWVYTTVCELVTNHQLDGLQYGAERTGPLSHVLYRGVTPTCFCEHCVQRNQQKGIDAARAKVGFTKLLALIQSVESNSAAGKATRAQPNTADGVLSSIMRIIYRHPEVLSWDYEWFQADEEICSEVHRIAKSICPDIDSGRHVDHQRSSWDFFYRSAMTYGQMAQNADYIKPIVYHESMGPRLRWWVLDRVKDRIFHDLSLEQSLQLYYAVFGHDPSAQPGVEDLDRKGLGPEYVYREVLRCKQAVGKQAKVYAGIGIDIPWYVPNGMEPRPSDPAQLTAAVTRAFDAGADGVLASREYNEMQLSSLEAFGRGIQ